MNWITAVDYRGPLGRQAAARSPRAFGKVAHHSGELVIGAVSDGRPTAPFGSQGARAAVNAAMEVMLAHAMPLGSAAVDEDFDRASRMMREVLDEVARAVNREAVNQVASVPMFDATLVAFLARPDALAATVIGNGILTYRSFGTDFALLAKGNCSPNGVAGLGIVEPPPAFVRRGPIRFVCAGSSALATSKTVRAGRKQRGRFFRPMDQSLGQAGDDMDANLKLRKLLSSDHVRHEAEDDLAMVAARYRESGMAGAVAAD